MIIIISRVFEKFGKKPKTEMYTREGRGWVGLWAVGGELRLAEEARF